MLPRIVGYYIQVGSVTNDEWAAECEMELSDEKELSSYIVENSEREGHFDYYEDSSKTWNCVWLQEGKLRLMLPSTIEMYTNVNKLWKDNDIKLRMEWSHITSVQFQWDNVVTLMSGEVILTKVSE